MAVSMSPKQKVYQGVLDVIREFIKDHHLQAGDKLPSERELVEKLQTSRSSIREALRSLELLGLIEVRRGEGTFISTYRPFHSVELLASFILLESNTKKDLLVVKQMLEKEGAKFAFYCLDEFDCQHLKSIVEQHQCHPKQRHLDFFQFLFHKVNNLLLMKIWGFIQEFSQTVDFPAYDVLFYDKLIQVYKQENFNAIEDIFADYSYHKQENRK